MPGFSLWALYGSTEAPQVVFVENDIRISPQTIRAGGAAVVTFKVTNTSGQAGTYFANLWLDQQIRHSLEVPMGPGQTRNISLPLVIAVPGSYEVRVGRQIAEESLQAVREAPASTPVPPTPPSTLPAPVAVPPTPTLTTAPPVVSVPPTPVPGAPAPAVPQVAPAAPEPESTVPPPTPGPVLAGVSIVPIIGEIEVSNPGPAAGDEVLVTIPVSHLGATAEDFPLEVLVGGQVVDQRVVTASPDETVRVEVTIVAPEGPAEITVRVADQVKMSAIAPVSSADDQGSGAGLVIAVLAALAVIAGGGGAFIYFRRRRAAA